MEEYDSRSLAILEQRNRAFRILYDTIISITTHAPHETYNILPRNLAKLTEAKGLLFVTINNERKESCVHYCESSGEVTSLKDDKLTEPFTTQAEKYLLKNSISSLTFRELELLSLCSREIREKCFKVPGESKAYVLSSHNNKEVVAYVVLITKDNKSLKMKDMVDTFLSLSAIILQRISQEVALKQSNDKFSQLLTNAPVGIMLVDEEYTITEINPAALMLLGRDKKEVVFKKCHEFVCPKQEDFCPWKGKNKQLARGEHILLQKNGEEVPILKTATRVQIGEKPFLIETFVDITEQRNATRQLIEAKRAAEHANEMKSQFLSNVSHEIRTPMNAILGFTQILKDTQLDKKQFDYVQTIHESGEVLLSIINDVLDLSKVEAGQVQLETIEFDLSQLVVSVIKMMHSRIKEKTVKVDCHIDKSVPNGFRGDPTRIRQILINLIGNAIKFTEEGRIDITVSLDDLDRGNDGRPGDIRILHFSVKDTGIGISEEQQQAIFDSFSQADISTTRKYGGTGLGLAITKAFVQKMGGDIHVNSHIGDGSDFIFTLRLEQAEPVFLTDVSPIRVEALEGKQVLLVDNDSHAIEIFMHYCKVLKMDILYVAHTIDNALSWLSTEINTPDLILASVMIKGVADKSLLERIRNTKRLRDAKVIALITDIECRQKEHQHIKEYDAFLRKPIIRETFATVLQNVFADKRKSRCALNQYKNEKMVLNDKYILIAEDNEINYKLIETILKSYGCIIDWAKNGREAIEQVRNNNYDVVLMDVQMSEMGGLEATRFIRNELKKDVPIIALTAGVMDADREKVIASGMNDYLSKPIDFGLLKRKLHKYASEGKV